MNAQTALYLTGATLGLLAIKMAVDILKGRKA